MQVPSRNSAGVRVDELVRLEDEEWDAAVAATGRRFRFSHRAAAGRALERAFPSYSYTPYRADYADGASILYPLVSVERRLPSLSMLLGMPLGLEGTPLPLAGAVTAGHVTSMFSAVGGHGSIAIHGGAGGSPPPAGRVSRWVTHALDLREGFEAVWKGSFTAKNRNVCRKAERAGVTVSRVGAERAGDYYALYAAMTRTWGYATPPYPRELISALLDTDDAELWLAYLGDELAAGALLMGGSGDLLYWSGAMNREHAQVAPSNAVLRTVIESACTRGIEYLDFGASTGLPGVEAFKRSFGASTREYTEVSWSSWRHRALESSRRRLAGLRGRA